MIIDLKKMIPSQRLRILRAKIGISSIDLACHCGVQPAVISRFERGRPGNISEAAKTMLAERLGVTVEDLFGEVEP